MLEGTASAMDHDILKCMSTILFFHATWHRYMHS